MHPKSQYQHRLPKVYLKPFGYPHRGRWYISVLEKGKDSTEQMDIETFTAELNAFDYSVLPDIEDRRHFELLCSKIETRYHQSVKSIKRGQLGVKEWQSVCEFMATLIARSESERTFYRHILKEKQTREQFFNEVTMFNEPLRDDLDIIAMGLDIEDQVQLLSVIAGEHLAKCLTRFQFRILKVPSNGGKKWFTSDNPVVINKQGHYGWLLPLEAEIYFPVSKEYCLFLYHEESIYKDHPLVGLPANKVHECDEVSFAYISMQISQNRDKYLLIPLKSELTFSRFENFEEWRTSPFTRPVE